MKAKDLMIGDWVFDERYGTPHKISLEEDFRFCCSGELCFKPIPLTAEILEKNGFKELTKIVLTKRVKNFIWMLKVEDILVEAIEVTSNVFQITIHRELSDLSDERVNIRYVHQLQHALRLCGINELADSIII